MYICIYIYIYDSVRKTSQIHEIRKKQHSQARAPKETKYLDSRSYGKDQGRLFCPIPSNVRANCSMRVQASCMGNCLPLKPIFYNSVPLPANLFQSVILRLTRFVHSVNFAKLLYFTSVWTRNCPTLGGGWDGTLALGSGRLSERSTPPPLLLGEPPAAAPSHPSLITRLSSFRAKEIVAIPQLKESQKVHNLQPKLLWDP